MFSDHSWRDRVALITGASQGLGLEIARLYASRGVRLTLTARGAEALQAAATELQQSTDVLAIAGDVADEAHARKLVNAAFERWGRIDILINNASELGPSPMPHLEHLPIGDFRALLDVNVVAPLQLMQRIVPSMRSRGEGWIFNVTSDAGVEAYAGWGGYGASKAALEHLSRIAAKELEGTGVRLVVVDPGEMNTRMHQLAEPGADLSHLPSPATSAPAFVKLVEEESRRFARVEAQKIALQEVV